MKLRDIKIGVVGGGVVGRATARAFVEHVADVRVWDIDPLRSTHPQAMVLDCDLILICLPTPQKPDLLECDLSAVERWLTIGHGESPDRESAMPYVLRSTVPIGTTRRLAEKYRLTNIVHWPEFLTARCSLVDAQVPSRNVLGGTDCECLRLLADGCRQRFPQTPLLTMTSDESETVKLITNAFFAVKVAFFNEMRSLTDDAKLDWDAVLNAVLADGRICPSHTAVPGPDGRRGFGGECLPKDLASVVHQLFRQGLTTGASVCKAALERNAQDRGAP